MLLAEEKSKSSEKHMAFFHLQHRVISRAGGKDAGAGRSARSSTGKSKRVSIAQRARYIERKAEYKDKNAEIQHTESVMPTWAKDNPGRYWSAADRYSRNNARLGRSFDIALPKELTTEQQIDLTRAFCREITKTKDGICPHTWAIHKGKGKNPHFHLILSERVMKENEEHSPNIYFTRNGALQTREFQSKDWLISVRQKWSQMTNDALAAAGTEQRIDHRSLKAQGIDREPQKHRGPYQTHITRREAEGKEMYSKEQSSGNPFSPTTNKKKKEEDRKSTRLNSSHLNVSRMPSSA
jgi:hypothetical protein